MYKNWLLIKLNNKYFLKVGSKLFRCQIGAGGLKNNKKKVEGDQATPIGKFNLESLYYRSDRVLRPKCKKKNVIKIKKITKHCGWCDDIKNNYYNRYIKINKFRSLNINYEKLWREDNAYDIIVVISHNLKPTIKNKGSAIFVHCSFSDYRNTSGCIALERKDLVVLMQKYEYGTQLKIKN